MIPGITEYTRTANGLQPGFPSYATLHQATVQFEEMGERTISTQVRIDGSQKPDFSGWELEFRGEFFVLPTLRPQASKDNTTRNSLVDLVFTSSAIYDLKRYYFAEMTQIDNGTVSGLNIIDKYVASLRLTLPNFVAAFNNVLQYYFPDGSYVMNLDPSHANDAEIKDFPIDYMYIWDVLQKIHEVYDVTWRIVRNQQGVNVIRVGYSAGSIPSTDHVFQYGFDGGLLRFERHVEDTDIYNVLLGRGGEKNIPYRYFKERDPFNEIWSPDPDAIPELRSVFFSRLLDSNFRKYVQGWKTNENRMLDPGQSVEVYDSVRGATDWAYAKGHNDENFDPVEYVKDDESIALYGVRQGKLDDNDDIYPTIQGVDIPNDNPDIGRVDEIVDVYVTDEESQEAHYDIISVLSDIYREAGGGTSMRQTIQSSETFSIGAGRVGRIEYSWLEDDADNGDPPTGQIDTVNSTPYVSDGTNTYGMSLIPEGGPYNYCVDIDVSLMTGASLVGKYGLSDLRLHCTPKDGLSYRQVFTIWVKNIWQSTQGEDESDVAYAHRIWDPILGNKLGESAAVCFSSGWMAASEDYEFLIQKLPEVDRTKTRNGVPSEWKITLLRSDAEYEATGLYIPNTATGGVPVAGDYFFFTGIDIPIQYVKWAEERLTASKIESLQSNAWTNPTYVISLDKIRAHAYVEYVGTLAERLDAGVLITITDPRFTLNNQGEQVQLQLGVRSVTFNWNEPTENNPYLIPDIEVVLSDKIVHTESYQGLQSEVNYISNYYATNAMVNKIKKSQSGVGISGNICYFGRVIGEVQE